MPAHTYRDAFPALTDANHAKTSRKDATYNCIGHAAGTELWWQPHPMLGGQAFWPPGVPRKSTLDAYQLAFEAIGYWKCPDGSYLAGFEKVALFEKGGDCKHAARQIDETYWSSKLGRNIDIKHELKALEGDSYGTVAIYLMRTSRA